MTKITYEGPDGTETREFGREELAINSDTGFIEFQISDDEGDSITKHMRALEKGGFRYIIAGERVCIARKPVSNS